MYDNQGKKRSGFPDPLLPREKKEEKEYGLRYAKAIQDQWGKIEESNSLYRKRRRVFDRNRAYANGTQDTSIYKQLLNSLDPSNSDGSMLNLDFTPVPILPKFVRIVVNKILSREPYPNLEAVDPLSSAEKDRERRKVEMKVQSKPGLKQIEQMLGKDMGTKDTPDTLEEAEIFIDTNLKTSGEVAAQVATNMTLKWNDFADSVYRRCVNDIATLGMSVIKRSNDPSQGIRTDYVDPANFIHSYTEDPNFGDIVYAGHIERISIQELKRRAGDQFTDEDYEKIAGKASKKYGYDSSKITQSSYDQYSNKNVYGYDEFMVDVLSFEFISVDTMYFEDKENKYGNKNLYYKGSSYKKPKNSIFEREVKKVENATVYGGCYIMGCDDYLFDYGMKTNMPKNIHDLSRVNMSYSVVATNLQNMMPKSLVDSCVGFADQLQLTHLKIQQAVAKAKPDGLIIDIEGLENVQVGKGGELQPLELHDIYEQTGVFYYRSKNPDGGFQNPPIREIGNSIRNINELIGLYNHYLRLIRDTTGINEAMDASSPKGDALVGVREQAIAAGNNAIYDITNASMVLFKKVCSDIVKCLQVIHPESVLYHIYENAIGEENMKVLSSFKNLMLYNFGVQVVKNMEESEKMLLEQNIQMALSQKELDLEDAIAIRNLKDVNQAERLLVVRRKKRLQSNQQMAQQNSQMQAQAQAQAAQAASQGRQQEMQLEAQLKAAEIKLKAEYEVHTATALHQLRREIELIRAQATLGFRTEEQEFREKLEVLKEDRKDDRIKKQAVQQSKLISQRQGARGELKGAPKEGETPDIDKAIDNILGQQ
jgi:hypothetical protein